MTQFLSQRAYEVLRYIIAVVLPATATLMSCLDSAWAWHLPMDAILTTFTGVETFLGAVFLISKGINDKDEAEAEAKAAEARVVAEKESKVEIASSTQPKAKTATKATKTAKATTAKK